MRSLRELPVDGVLVKLAVAVPVAENGCFIKTKGTKTLTTWIDMMANVNFTSCIKILNYVRPPILPIPIPFVLD